MLKKRLLIFFCIFCTAVFALDPARADAWLISEAAKKKGDFDVFYIHPTLLRDKKNPYPDFKNPAVRRRLVTFSRAQTGIFGEDVRVFAPAVRQLEIGRCLEDMKKYGPGITKNSRLYPAVQDALAAFKHYLKNWNPGGKRPYILLGHSQGAMDLYELLRLCPEIRPDRGFTAAYLLGLPGITAQKIKNDLGKRGIFPAEDEGTTGVVIVWNTRSPGGEDKYFTVKGGYGINPLHWRTDTLKADKKFHLGMTIFDHKSGRQLLYMYRNAPRPVCSARLDKNGVLLVEDIFPAAEKLYAGAFGKGCFHMGDVWMFSENIAANARKRVRLQQMKNQLDDAKKMIRTGKAECVLLQKGKISQVERGRGVSPLLRMYDKDPRAMAGGILVDKVIGRAAAAIAICAKVKFVHGQIISEDARQFLSENGIPSSGVLHVHRILNRRRNGLCPLEKSVQGINDPEKALEALRKKISELMRSQK